MGCCLRGPSPDDDYGDGKPFHGRSGEKFVAKRLTMQIPRVSRGDGMAGFNRPLSYRPLGVA
jgi:hypothetical protein